MADEILSVVIPACNEECNVGKALVELTKTLKAAAIPYEIIVVNDNSSDGTLAVLQEFVRRDAAVRFVNRKPPGGFGRAIRSGLQEVKGELVVIYMADLSDDPRDVVTYYRKIQEGYECVFGSRFIRGSCVRDYPRVKYVINRIVNKIVQWAYRCPFNDLTNAFKCYRTYVIRESGPYQASHFNITIEMSLGALNRRYRVAQVPIRWFGRTWGSSNLRLRAMGRRYLSTFLKAYAERLLISEDVIAERDVRHQEMEALRAEKDPHEQ
jgi:dolichol-phosphate mannosyltransferase